MSVSTEEAGTTPPPSSNQQEALDFVKGLIETAAKSDEAANKAVMDRLDTLVKFLSHLHAHMHNEAKDFKPADALGRK